MVHFVKFLLTALTFDDMAYTLSLVCSSELCTWDTWEKLLICHYLTLKLCV